MSRLARHRPLPFSSSIFFALVMLISLSVTLLQTAGRQALAPAWPSPAQQHETLQLAESLAQQQSQLLGQTTQLLRVLSGISFPQESEKAVCDAFLARQLESFPAYDNLAILDTDGSIRCQARFLPEPFVQPGAATHRGVALQRAGDHLAFIFTPAAATGEHEVSTLAMLPLSELFRADRLHIPPGSDLALVDTRSKTLYPGTPGTLLAAQPALLAQLLALPPGAVLQLPGVDAVPRLYSRQALPSTETPLSLIAGVPLGEQDSKTTPYILGAMPLLVTVAAAGMAGLLYFLLRRAKASRIRPQLILSSIGTWLRQWLARKNTRPAGEASATELQRDNEVLKQAFAKHEKRVRQITYLDQFSQFLQSCTKSSEVAGVVAQFAQELFPHSAGALLLRASPDMFEAAVTWGGSTQRESFPPDDCWALRLGKVYHVHHPAAGACCGHLTQVPAEYVCIPLSAHGEVLGVLHLSGHAGRDGEQAPHTSNLAPWAVKSLAERTAMALSGIRHDELLRNQATRDALTGLYNRHFMEETLKIEERRAERHGTSIGLMMLDVDHFKRFNDTFGHDAGDTVLRSIGALLRDSVREGDMPCRLGGEEFVIVLPNSDPQGTWQRAESLRLAVEQLVLELDGKALGKVTVSIGVASVPHHGDTWQSALKAADLALYEGKHGGRNRVVMAK